MALTARKPEGPARETPAKGTHAARLLGITDLGHQPGFMYEGKKVESSWKFEFTYELVNHEMEDGRPFVVSEELTNNDWEDIKTGRCSTLIARAKSLMGDNYRQGMNNIPSMLSKACMVSVTHNANGYAKVKGQAAVSGVPFGMEVPQLRNDAYFFDMDAPDMDQWEKMPEFKQNKIKAALNFEETALFRELSTEAAF